MKGGVDRSRDPVIWGGGLNASSSNMAKAMESKFGKHVCRAKPDIKAL